MYDGRTPLEVGAAVAARFMRIHPRPHSYMYSFGLSGILRLWEATREQKYLDFYIKDFETHGGGQKGERLSLALYFATGDRQWLKGVAEAGERMLANPRRDREGSWLDPRGRYTIDCLSGLFPWPIQYGHILRDHRYFDEAVRQYEVHKGYIEDPNTGVWYSRSGNYLHQNRPNPGLWSRGNGWLVNMWGQTMHLWDPKHAAYRHMLDEWQQYCKAVAAFQTDSGLYRQLLNRADSFEEASGTGLMSSGFAHGVLHGTLPAELASAAYRGFCGLRALTDRDGNTHNGSTFAGGYIYERQYYSCARFNEAHADGGIMLTSATVHMLLEQGKVPSTEEPSRPPVIITRPVPGLLSHYSSDSGEVKSSHIPGILLKRMAELTELPQHDLFGATILGLLHWYDHSKDDSVLAQARERFSQWRDQLSPTARWNVAAELHLRTREGAFADGLQAFVDAELARLPRDRAGLIVDTAGGYSVETVYAWVPLLAKTAAITGDRRYFDEACAQLFGHLDWLEDPLTLFWYSAFGRGAHPRRVTPGLWALGNGYVVAALTELMDRLPHDHPRWVDTVCLARGLVGALAEYLPVSGSWPQILDRFDSPPCSAATGLITYGTAKAVMNRWVHYGLYAAPKGGMHGVVAQVRKGTIGTVSLPTGGLDTIAAYEQHMIHDDPYALGMLLSGCAYDELMKHSGVDPNPDKRLGAR